MGRFVFLSMMDRIIFVGIGGCCVGRSSLEKWKEAVRLLGMYMVKLPYEQEFSNHEQECDRDDGEEVVCRRGVCQNHLPRHCKHHDLNYGVDIVAENHFDKLNPNDDGHCSG